MPLTVPFKRRTSFPTLHSAILIASATLGGTTITNATNLLEIYDQAATNDPTILTAESVRLATREARPQAWSSLLPNISANANWSNTECSGYNQCISSGVPVTTSPNSNVITQRGG